LELTDCHFKQYLHPERFALVLGNPKPTIACAAIFHSEFLMAPSKGRKLARRVPGSGDTGK